MLPIYWVYTLVLSHVWYNFTRDIHKCNQTHNNDWSFIFPKEFKKCASQNHCTKLAHSCLKLLPDIEFPLCGMHILSLYKDLQSGCNSRNCLLARSEDHVDFI